MTDRRPLPFDGRWLWHPVPAGGCLEEQTDYLPPAVFAALAGHDEKPAGVTARVKAYPTRAAAVLALARAVFLDPRAAAARAEGLAAAGERPAV